MERRSKLKSFVSHHLQSFMGHPKRLLLQIRDSMGSEAKLAIQMVAAAADEEHEPESHKTEQSSGRRLPISCQELCS